MIPITLNECVEFLNEFFDGFSPLLTISFSLMLVTSVMMGIKKIFLK